MTNKIVALNSGGLDSVVMLHELREAYPEAEIHSIFFSYGQKAYIEELMSASKVVGKLNLKFEVIELPKMSWSNSGLIEDTTELYLEMRNLIFLSYAISYAESIGAKDIYVAFIEPLGYYDTTYKFVEDINRLVEGLGIDIIAPFHTFSKEWLIPSIRKFCIRRDEFFSCLKTEELTGKKCGNCDVIDYMYKYYIDPFLLDDLFMVGDFERFDEVKKSMEITTAKININDRCNLKCSYCFIEDREPRELPLSGYTEIIDKLHYMGIEHIDFFGKEPLLNDRIFKLVDYANIIGYKFKYTFITNGVNLEKYADEIIARDFESITVSYEGEAEKTGRSFIPNLDVIKNIIEKGVKVNISIDLHKSNADNIIENLVPKFEALGIKEIYIKPIIPIGKEKEVVKSDFYMQIDDFREFINKLGETKPSAIIKIGIPLYYNKLAREIMMNMDLMTNTYKGMYINHDLYCTAGLSSIYIDSEGNVYGCGFIPSGCRKQVPMNILTDSLETIKKEVKKVY